MHPLLWLLALAIFAPIAPFFLLLLIPGILYFFPTLLADIFFMNWRRTVNPHFDDPSAAKVKSFGRCFYLTGEQGRIGVWHLLPNALNEKYKGKSGIEIEASVANENFPVVFYAHGNSFDRSSEHRCMLYNVLNEQNYHVFCFDYRGYGDSPGVPTEDGIVKDARTVYDHVSRISGNRKLIIWGHSMGTGVATRLVRELCLENSPPHGLVLESAFNNLHDVVLYHPFTRLFRHLPQFITESFLVAYFRKSGLEMSSDRRITDISCPILLLHAQDDPTIPVLLAHRLVAVAKSSGLDLEYVEFTADRKFAHKFICNAEELPGIMEKFSEKCGTIKI